MKKYFTTVTFLVAATTLFAQDSTKNNLTLSAYAEAYYSYDFNNPSVNSKGAVYIQLQPQQRSNH